MIAEKLLTKRCYLQMDQNSMSPFTERMFIVIPGAAWAGQSL